MPQVKETEERLARYKITSDGTEPSYRGTLKAAEINVATRVGLGYKNIHLIVLEPSEN